MQIYYNYCYICHRKLSQEQAVFHIFNLIPYSCVLITLTCKRAFISNAVNIILFNIQHLCASTCIK